MNFMKIMVVMHSRCYLNPYIDYLVIEIIHSHIVSNNNNNLWIETELWNIRD